MKIIVEEQKKEKLPPMGYIPPWLAHRKKAVSLILAILENRGHAKVFEIEYELAANLGTSRKNMNEILELMVRNKKVEFKEEDMYLFGKAPKTPKQDEKEIQPDEFPIGDLEPDASEDNNAQFDEPKEEDYFDESNKDVDALAREQGRIEQDIKDNENKK